MCNCQGNFLQEPRLVNGLLSELPWRPEAALNDHPKHNQSSLGTIPINHTPRAANCPHRSQNIPCSAYFVGIQTSCLGRKGSSKVSEQIPPSKIPHRIFPEPKCCFWLDFPWDWAGSMAMPTLCDYTCPLLFTQHMVLLKKLKRY